MPTFVMVSEMPRDVFYIMIDRALDWVADRVALFLEPRSRGSDRLEVEGSETP